MGMFSGSFGATRLVVACVCLATVYAWVPSTIGLATRSPLSRTTSPLQYGRVLRRNAGWSMSASSLPAVEVGETLRYLRDMASPEDELPSARELELLLGVLSLRGQDMLKPADRMGIHPLVMPLARDPKSKSVTGLLKMPLKPAIDLPVVRTNGKGLELLALSCTALLKRTAIEEDHSSTNCSEELCKLVKDCGIDVTPGASKASPLGLEKFLLTKAGAFPDIYEWLANDWLSKGKTEEAMITCARAAGLLPEWGKCHWVHARTLAKIGGRDLESRDCARAALQLPLWTVGTELEAVVAAAESTMEKMIKSYDKWAVTGGPEEDFVNSSRSGMQIALGRADYLMDTVMLNEGKTWDSIRDELGTLYEAADLPEFARFVRCK